MTRTLQPDDRIARYHVVGPLGSGGMGEVHSARDEELERNVALKVLPRDLVRNEERVRRFVAEAKAASALSHPNIVTIYEIGHDLVRAGGGGESPVEKIHYIAMELVSGETLDQKIHRERTDLRTLVGYLAQAAEGVAKAHAAGVVHRDLKPGNIMVSKDGFAKVLDFGLAKLVETEASGDDHTSAPTAAAATRAGTLMGTVGYMSPEQVQAKPVDHRSDIFSMGIILYEAAARRRPFVADTDIEVMHQILRDQPPPVEELNPDVPSALRRIIRRCLAKSPEKRLQSMKDLAIELREIVEEWDSLNLTSSSPRSLSSSALGAPPPRPGRSRWLVGGAVLVALAGLGVALASFLRQEPASPAGGSVQTVQMTPILSRNDLREAALSADGRYLAYVTSTGLFTRLHIRQVRTGSDVTIVDDSEVPISDVSFSPDGDYLYFRNRDPELPNYSALFQVPSLGGTPRKVLFDVDSAVSFSPDGLRVCFRRGQPQDQADSLVVAELASGEERELVRVDSPTRFRAAPAWSPDGTKIAVGLQTISRGPEAWIEQVDLETGERIRLGDPDWLEIRNTGWLGDGDAIVVSAFDLAAGVEPQLYRLSVADGRIARITSDLDGYDNLSVSADGGTIAAVRRSTVSNMWVARVEVEDDATPLTFASGSAASMSQLAPMPGDVTIFSAPRDNRFVLWRMDADGSNRQQLTTDGVWIFDLAWTTTSGIVFSQVVAEPAVEAHVWRIDADGTGLEQLTHGESEQLVAISADGGRLIFREWSRPGELWGLRLDGSEPFLLAEGVDDEASFSPDGERVLMTRIEDLGDGRFFPVRHVVLFDRAEPWAKFALPPGAGDIEWAPDGASLTYVDRSQGWNVMRKILPDGPVEPLTSFTEGQVVGHEWHRDGSRLVLHRRFDQKESLWQLRTGQSEPTLVVEYKTGRLSRYRWAPDAPLLYYAYSTSTQDVVMMTGVR